MKKSWVNEKTGSLLDAAESSGASAVLLSGPESVTYFTGAEFPFAPQFPGRPLMYFARRARSPVLICPYEWSGSTEVQGFQGEILSYGDGEADPAGFISEAVTRFLRESGPDMRAAVEMDRVPAKLLSLLEEKNSKVRFFDAGPAVRDLRIVKTPGEIELLRTAAEQLESGLTGALQHLEGSIGENIYTIAEFCERIRVHVYESGGTGGGLASAAAGKGSARLYSNPAEKFKTGELVRVEATSRYRGWWAAASRMLTIGEADVFQKRAYAENIILKKKGLEMLLPGTKCSDIFSAVEDAAFSGGIDFRREFGVGHGIGSAEIEEPRLGPFDGTLLRENMCIVLGVYTEGPGKELICSKDTYRITGTGPECISGYYIWDKPYEITGFRSAH